MSAINFVPARRLLRLLLALVPLLLSARSSPNTSDLLASDGRFANTTDSQGSSRGTTFRTGARHQTQRIETKRNETAPRRRLTDDDITWGQAWYYPTAQTNYYLASSTTFSFTSTWTLQTWVKPRTVSSTRYWLTFATSSDTECIALQASMFSSTSSWYYVVIEWDGSDMTVYRNGRITASGVSKSFCGDYTGSLVFGQAQDSVGGGFSDAANTGMYQDTVAIYSTSNAQSVSTASSTDSVDTGATNLYVLWVGGGDGTDETGNGNDATVSSSGEYTGVTVAYSESPTSSPTNPSTSTYTTVSSGANCEYWGYTSLTSSIDCDAAAASLFSTTSTSLTSYSYPPYCYYRVYDGVYFNSYSSSGSYCTSTRACVCKTGDGVPTGSPTKKSSSGGGNDDDDDAISSLGTTVGVFIAVGAVLIGTLLLGCVAYIRKRRLMNESRQRLILMAQASANAFRMSAAPRDVEEPEWGVPDAPNAGASGRRWTTTNPIAGQAGGDAELVERTTNQTDLFGQRYIVHTLGTSQQQHDKSQVSWLPRVQRGSSRVLSILEEKLRKKAWVRNFEEGDLESLRLNGIEQGFSIDSSGFEGSSFHLLEEYELVTDARLGVKIEKLHLMLHRIRIDTLDGHHIAAPVLLSRSSVLESAYAHCKDWAPRDWRMTVRFKFQGEEGVDAGGVSREFWELVGKDIFSPDLGLFLFGDTDNLCFQINPDAQLIVPDFAEWFRFVGRLFAKALMDRQQLAAHLNLPLLKLISGRPITFDDLESKDSELHRNMMELLKLPEDQIEYCGLDFTVDHEAFGATTNRELKEGGAGIDVTKDNILEFMELRLKERLLDSIREPLFHLLTGFYEVLPQWALLPFSAAELELLLCGVPTINVDDWKSHTEYYGEYARLKERHQVMQWFWSIIENEYRNEQRAKFLQFVTGTSRLPLEGFSGLQGRDGAVRLFNIRPVSRDQSAYPRSHTCFNQLDLPVYSSREEMRSRLEEALSMNLTGFSMV